jgi:hypothetical protein
MVIVVQVLRKETKRNLVEVLDGARFVVVTLHVFKSMIYIYVDSALEKLQTPWGLKN